MSIVFAFHRTRRDWSNFSLLRNRHYDGFLISMHQSGTHWLKHMLGSAIASKYRLPPPSDLGANDIIGGPKDSRKFTTGPYLVSTHSIPHYALRWRWLRDILALPPYVVLVRDIRATLVSNYEKWKHHYQCDFPEYVRGDMRGARFNNDLWWCLRFCNAWGDILAADPPRVLLVKYETLLKDTLGELQRINRFWRLGLSEPALVAAIRVSGKAQMARKTDYNAQPGIEVVRADERHYLEWFSADDLLFLQAACRAYLKHDFGYDYEEPTVSASAS